MGLSIAIIGLPNVGKSTFFQILTKNTNALIANYPFATINPNIGIVHLEDRRTQQLQQIFKSKKIVPNFIKFIDIAGLVKGASKGKGLGNKFLSNIKETDVMCNIIRCFENKDILHVENRINPIKDIKIINFELIIDDLKNINNMLNLSFKKIKYQDPKQYQLLIDTLTKAKNILEKEQMLDDFSWSEDQLKVLLPYNLLTIKKRFYVINVNENEWNNLNSLNYFNGLINYLENNKLSYVIIPLKFEHDLLAIDTNDKAFYQDIYNIKKSAVNDVINLGFQLLNLKTFFTCGPEEIHSWSFKNGTNAKKAAGIIHSDIEKGFIKAEIFSCSDLLKYNDLKKIKELGLVKIEGKDYLINDGDICYFHFSK